MNEKQQRNIQRLKEAIEEIAKISSYDVWRIADIVNDAYEMGKEKVEDEEYKKQLDLLINSTLLKKQKGLTNIC